MEAVEGEEGVNEEEDESAERLFFIEKRVSVDIYYAIID